MMSLAGALLAPVWQVLGFVLVGVLQLLWLPLV